MAIIRIADGSQVIVRISKAGMQYFVEGDDNIHDKLTTGNCEIIEATVHERQLLEEAYIYKAKS